MVISQHDVVMVDRKDAPGLGMDLNQNGQGFVKRSQRYNLNDYMKNSSGLINSPQSPARAIHALRANALAQLPGNDSVENL